MVALLSMTPGTYIKPRSEGRSRTKAVTARDVAVATFYASATRAVVRSCNVDTFVSAWTSATLRRSVRRFAKRSPLPTRQ